MNDTKSMVHQLGYSKPPWCYGAVGSMGSNYTFDNVLKFVLSDEQIFENLKGWCFTDEQQ